MHVLIIASCSCIHYHNHHNYYNCFVLLFFFLTGPYLLIVLPDLIQTVVNQSDLLWGQTQSARHISSGF